jgi:predicted transcriptional regulator YheO
MKYKAVFRYIAGVVAPAVIITVINIYAISLSAHRYEKSTIISGKPLASHEEFYPVQVNSKGELYLDMPTFEKAVEYFSLNPSLREIADIVYLGTINHVDIRMNTPSRRQFQGLVEMLKSKGMKDVEQDKEEILRSYVEIVNTLGATFSDTPMEFVLHDTRNPLRSVVAVQNTITGRRIGDPLTNFGVQLVKTYSTHSKGNVRNTSFTSYALMLPDGRQVKATTIPVFHERYGLIAFICINVDLSKLSDPKAAVAFVEAFKSVRTNDAISEIIQTTQPVSGSDITGQ